MVLFVVFGKTLWVSYTVHLQNKRHWKLELQHQYFYMKFCEISVLLSEDYKSILLWVVVPCGLLNCIVGCSAMLSVKLYCGL